MFYANIRNCLIINKLITKITIVTNESAKKTRPKTTSQFITCFDKTSRIVRKY
jgi:hypothetical protein